ncbi:membrane protein YfhO [Chitinophaga costaii]|uniref:Membrane protein YfhO n=1 Tax=Chitinophaga costaii TaxID=1335309 RepID=A0A1C4ECR2_9BACT|nr:YfhO family protein [Chitinophaga costaii]PUZ23904.1 hypothetical protein DCM91_14035 [Chitinophaga costaii]SCC41409.1 membrane protein YfhO [Chitinophaga costaii]
MKNNWLKVALPHFVAALILLLIAVIYCKPVLSGKVLSQSDNLSWQASAKESLDYKAKHGITPLWTTSVFSGMPTYQLSAESPYQQLAWVQPIFSLGLPKPISYFFLAGLGFYLLGVVLGANPYISLVGAIGYAYSTYDPIIVAVGHDSKMMAMSYLPFVIAGLMLILQKRYFLGTGVMALFLSYLISANHLQVTYYFFLILGVICLVFAIYNIIAKQYKHLLISAGMVILSVAFGIGSNAMVLWTTYEYSKASNRGGQSELTPQEHADGATAGVPGGKDYAFSWSYGVFETFTFVVPNLYGGSDGEKLSDDSNTAKALKNMGVPDAQASQFLARLPTYWGQPLGTSGPVYLGAIICFLAIMGWVLVQSWHKWWLLATSVVGILLAWGSNFSSLNYFLFDHLPFYSKFRAPSQALIIPQLSFAVMAALGLQALISNSYTKPELWKKVKQSGYIMAGILGFLLLASFFLSFSGGRDEELKQQAGPDLVAAIMKDRAAMYRSDLFRSIFLVALAFGLIYFYLQNKLKQAYLLSGFVVLVAIDLFQVDLRYLNSDNYQDDNSYAANFKPTAADEQILQDKDYYRVLNLADGRDPYQDPVPSYFHKSIGGYHPAKLQLYVDLIDRQLRKNNIRVLNMLNTRYIITPSQAPGQPGQPSAGGEPVAQRNPEALGNAWFVQNIVWADNADAEMKMLDSLDTRHTVVIDKRYKAEVTNPPSPVIDSIASIQLVSNDLNSISYTSNAPTNQYAVFSEIYYKAGWKAFLDGKQVPYSRVNYLLRGLSVPAGKHEITFKFEPTSYYAGSKIAIFSYAATLLLVLAGLVLAYRTRKQPLPA